MDVDCVLPATRRRSRGRPCDATNPDLSAFHKRGGKMLVTIGTNDTLASPGAQLDYFQSVLVVVDDAIGKAVERVTLPHESASNRIGKTVAAAPLPNRYDQTGLLFDWVENNVAPGMSVTVTAGEKSLPLCSYPTYPRYKGGAPAAASYECAAAVGGLNR